VRIARTPIYPDACFDTTLFFKRPSSAGVRPTLRPAAPPGGRGCTKVSVGPAGKEGGLDPRHDGRPAAQAGCPCEFLPPKPQGSTCTARPLCVNAHGGPLGGPPVFSIELGQGQALARILAKNGTRLGPSVAVELPARPEEGTAYPAALDDGLAATWQAKMGVPTTSRGALRTPKRPGNPNGDFAATVSLGTARAPTSPLRGR